MKPQIDRDIRPIDAYGLVVSEADMVHGATETVTCRHAELLRHQNVDSGVADLGDQVAKRLQGQLLVGPANNRLLDCSHGRDTVFIGHEGSDKRSSASSSGAELWGQPLLGWGRRKQRLQLSFDWNGYDGRSIR
jgi:hypothetical protein